MSRLMTKPTEWHVLQRRLRSASASTQSDQSLPCALNRLLKAHCFFVWTAKTLIRLGGCPGWSESSLAAQVILLVLSCGGSNVFIVLWHLFCSSEIRSLRVYIQVMQLIPDSWSIALLSQFLTQSVRRSMNCNRMTRIERMMSRGENLIVKQTSIELQKEPVTMNEEKWV